MIKDKIKTLRRYTTFVPVRLILGIEMVDWFPKKTEVEVTLFG